LTDSLTRLIRLIKKSKKILIATHIDPDCDGICSTLIMARLIQHFKKKTPELFCHSPIPEKYQFLLNGYKFSKNPSSFDLLVVLDSADLERVFPKGCYDISLLDKRFVINIDHHDSNKNFGSINIVDTKASSACEIVYKIFKKFRIPIDHFLAEVFYAGIYNETGGFMYPNTTPGALKICSELVHKGIEPAAISKRLNAKTLGGTRLLSVVLSTIKIRKGVGIMYMTQEMLRKNRAKMSDSENFISFLQAIKGVRVSVFFREEKNGTRISLRSDGLIDVNKFACKFGGGGHSLAAGIRLKEGLPAAKKKILTALFGIVGNENTTK